MKPGGVSGVGRRRAGEGAARSRPALGPWVAGLAAAAVAGWLFGRGMYWVQWSVAWGWVRELAAPWAVLAFAAGCATPVVAASAVAGWASLTVAVVSFYGLSPLSPAAWLRAGPWPLALLAAAVVVGPAMGALGAAWRQARPWHWLASGLACGLLCAEGVVLAWRPPTAALPRGVFLVEAAIGLLLAAGLGRSVRGAARACATCAAVVAAGALAEAATGVITFLYLH